MLEKLKLLTSVMLLGFRVHGVRTSDKLIMQPFSVCIYALKRAWKTLLLHVAHTTCHHLLEESADKKSTPKPRILQKQQHDFFLKMDTWVTADSLP